MNSTMDNLIPKPNGNWLKLVFGIHWGHSRQWRIGLLVHSLDYLDWPISTCAPFLPTWISSLYTSLEWWWALFHSLNFWLWIFFCLDLFIYYYFFFTYHLFFLLFFIEIKVQVSSLFPSRIDSDEKILVSTR